MGCKSFFRIKNLATDWQGLQRQLAKKQFARDARRTGANQESYLRGVGRTANCLAT
ncbi:hypothetical protein [uncultured Draconibacterium sp.]|uniref:hypothetical protein n=1 Tax=uncultured Draconibacterium sp. TaxID=1573823 RepID=UPI0025D4B6FF|nr:hypothetical protein [uncultured Draconibacterium sp.]